MPMALRDFDGDSRFLSRKPADTKMTLDDETLEQLGYGAEISFDELRWRRLNTERSPLADLRYRLSDGGREVRRAAALRYSRSRKGLAAKRRSLEKAKSDRKEARQLRWASTVGVTPVLKLKRFRLRKGFR